MHSNSLHPTPQSPRLLRRAEVLTYLGLCPSKFHADVRDGLMTQPVRLGSKTARWPDFEVSAIVLAHISGADNAAIRELVQELHAARRGQLQ